MGLDMLAPQWSARIHVLVDWLIRAHVLYQTERGMELLHGHSTRATLNRACLVSALVSRGGGWLVGWLVVPADAGQQGEKLRRAKKRAKIKVWKRILKNKGRSREEVEGGPAGTRSPWCELAT